MGSFYGLVSRQDREVSTLRRSSVHLFSTLPVCISFIGSTPHTSKKVEEL